MTDSLRRFVCERAGNRCEYCGIHRDDDFNPFHIEHIVSKKHGGLTHPDNLCLSCRKCNEFKGTDISAVEDHEAVKLFHPRKQSWTRHFEVGRDGRIRGKTRCGKATVRILKFNEEGRVGTRADAISNGTYPLTGE